MAKTTPMTQEDAARIQSHADKTGSNQDFKQRAQSAADKHAAGSTPGAGKAGSGGGNQGGGSKKSK